MFCSLKYLNLIFLDSCSIHIKKKKITKINNFSIGLTCFFNKFSDLNVFNFKGLSSINRKCLVDLNLTETSFCFFEYSLLFYCFCLNKRLKFSFFNILSERKKVLYKVLINQRFFFYVNYFCDFFLFSSLFFSLFVTNNNFYIYNKLQYSGHCNVGLKNLGFYNLNYFFYFKKNILNTSSIWFFFRPHKFLFTFKIYMKILGSYVYFNSIFLSFFGFFNYLVKK